MLDGPWDKVERSKRRLRELIERDTITSEALFKLMGDRERGPADDIERGRLDVDTAHAITAPFIILPEYGTRCTTVILVDRRGRWQFFERRFDSSGRRTGDSDFSFIAAGTGVDIA